MSAKQGAIKCSMCNRDRVSSDSELYREVQGPCNKSDFSSQTIMLSYFCIKAQKLPNIAQSEGPRPSGWHSNALSFSVVFWVNDVNNMHILVYMEWFKCAVYVRLHCTESHDEQLFQCDWWTARCIICLFFDPQNRVFFSNINASFKRTKIFHVIHWLRIDVEM